MSSPKKTGMSGGVKDATVHFTVCTFPDSSFKDAGSSTVCIFPHSFFLWCWVLAILWKQQRCPQRNGKFSVPCQYHWHQIVVSWVYTPFWSSCLNLKLGHRIQWVRDRVREIKKDPNGKIHGPPEMYWVHNKEQVNLTNSQIPREFCSSRSPQL